MAEKFTPTDVDVRVYLEHALHEPEIDRWFAQHDAALLTRAADEILRRRSIVGSSGRQRDDESWDNGNMSAEAIVRSLAEATSADARPHDRGPEPCWCGSLHTYADGAEPSGADLD